jgi:hypothetical protein
MSARSTLTIEVSKLSPRGGAPVHRPIAAGRYPRGIFDLRSALCARPLRNEIG